jgi:rhamnosyltransferase subunit B
VWQTEKIMTFFNSLPDVILFTRGTKGDLYPFLRIGGGLKEKGCKITLLSNYCYENYADQEKFDFVPMDDKESFETLNNTPELHGSLSSKLKLSKDHMIANLEQEVKIIESKISKANTVILAHSNDYLAPLFAMEKCGVSLYLCMLAPSYVHGFLLFEALLKSLSVDVNEIRTRIGLEPIEDWKRWLNSFEKCFAVWPDWFSGDAKKIAPDLECVGFLSIDSVEKKPLQKEMQDFIGVSTRNILITHGTSRPFNDLYFKLAINAIQKLGYKLIVSTPFRELLPEQLPQNVFWVEFCSFHELLPMINLVIHHGGIGTTRESIDNAVPQLIIGQGFDRQHNGRIVKERGLGDWIIPKALTIDTLYQKINDLLSDHNVKLKCEEYKLFLYNEEAINAFYETITSQKTDRSSVKFSHEYVAQEINSTDKVNLSLEKELTADKTNTSSEEKSKCLDDLWPKGHQTPNKQQLLLKMLKNKMKEAYAQTSQIESSRGH